MRLKELKNVKSTKTRKLKTKNKNTRKNKKGGSSSDQTDFNDIVTKKENTIDDAKRVFTIFSRSCKLNSQAYDNKTENVMNRNLSDKNVKNENTLVKEFSDDYDYKIVNRKILYENLKKLGGESDHRPLYFKVINDFRFTGKEKKLKNIYKNEKLPSIFTWNTLHHEGFNNLFSPNQNDNFLTKDLSNKLEIMSENQRYNAIANKISDYMNKKEFECISLQECEFSLYKKILENTNTCRDKNEYYSRYYPRKIRLGKGETDDEDFNKQDKQLDIKSYGNAIFVKKEEGDRIESEALMKESDGDLIIDKRDETLKYKIDTKIIKCKKGNNTYSSVHIPVMKTKPDKTHKDYKSGKRSYNTDLKKYYAALEFLQAELEFLFKDVERMNDNEKLWLIGDFNLDADVLTEELKKYSKNMVDFIFVKSGERMPYGDSSAYKTEYDGSGSTPRDHIILCVKKPFIYTVS